MRCEAPPTSLPAASRRPLPHRVTPPLFAQGCGFGVFPTFGLTAFKWTWFFDWNQSYIGSGMICPHIVNWSMLLGAIVSWGIMWPLITKRQGDW
jgi:hypothetical protein